MREDERVPREHRCQAKEELKPPPKHVAEPHSPQKDLDAISNWLEPSAELGFLG